MSAAAAPHAHAAAPVGSRPRACPGGLPREGLRGHRLRGRERARRGGGGHPLPQPEGQAGGAQAQRIQRREKRQEPRGVCPATSGTRSRRFARSTKRWAGAEHRNDHGAVLLVDQRYAHGANDALVRNLPKWLRPATRKCADLTRSVAGLRVFQPQAKRTAEAARAPPPRLLPRWARRRTRRRGMAGRERGRQAEEQQGSRGGCETARHKAVLPAGGAAATAAAAAADAFERARKSPRFPLAAPPVEESVRKSPAPVAAPPPRWRSAPVPAVFAPPRPAPDPLVTSQLTDPPSTTRTREVTETAPAASPGKAKSGDASDGHPDENPGFASARGLELAMELTEDIFVWGDDAETVGTSPKKNSHRLRSADYDPEDPPTTGPDADELSVWGETPDTQGFGARGWGATQQFRNFAPALDPVPETNAPGPSGAKPDRAEPSPETEPSPAPARVSLPTDASATDDDASKQHKPHASLRRPRGLGFGRVAVCSAAVPSRCRRRRRWRSPTPRRPATPARRVAPGPADGTRDGPAYLAALARANAEETQTRLGCHRARLFQPGEPFPLRCASAVRVRSPKNKLAGPVARGDADAPAMPAMPLSPEARGRADLGAWSRADGAISRRAAARGVCVWVEATDGARPRSSRRPPSSLTFRRRRAARLRRPRGARRASPAPRFSWRMPWRARRRDARTKTRSRVFASRGAEMTDRSETNAASRTRADFRSRTRSRCSRRRTTGRKRIAKTRRIPRGGSRSAGACAGRRARRRRAPPCCARETTGMMRLVRRV